jgi:hypothetical protein
MNGEEPHERLKDLVSELGGEAFGYPGDGFGGGPAYDRVLMPCVRGEQGQGR